MARNFPFSAIVGQERMKLALVLNAVNPRVGGVLIRGERGTAKSTAARALATLLPQMPVFVDSPFNDDPTNSETWSDWVRDRQNRGQSLTVGEKSIPFIDLPVSATEDRVVGTLDIEKAIQKGERHFEAGVLAAANRGILYIDEVNLLDDHVVDLLLDSAAMGVNVVEREGISFSHPARFILIGTMNPEEGDLRPQLLDRFALSAEVIGLKDPLARVTVLERNLAFEQSPTAFLQHWQAAEQELGAQIVAARTRLAQVSHTRRDLLLIASLTTQLGVDGHRADLVILRAALAHAAFVGHTRLERADILLAAELALPHRLRKNPLQSGTTAVQDLAKYLTNAESSLAEENAETSPADPADAADAQKKKLMGR